jgi:hypothetical protein
MFIYGMFMGLPTMTPPSKWSMLYHGLRDFTLQVTGNHIHIVFVHAIPVVPHKAVAEVSKIGNL